MGFEAGTLGRKANTVDSAYLQFFFYLSSTFFKSLETILALGMNS